MKIVRTVSELRAALRPFRSTGSVGLVPTMGALHDGHLELARRAAAENDAVVMSIFVNPTQFNDPADLLAYPRDEAADAELAAGAGVDFLFAPAPEEVYPPGFSATVELHGPIVESLEGARRGAGHFRGVTTVVAKLLGMAQPDRAYFGQKDAQQARVIRALVADLNINTEIVTVPTVREPDGLAMSSRNRRLNAEHRTHAVAVSKALLTAKQLAGGGEHSAPALLRSAAEVLGRAGIVPEYLALVDAETFLPVTDLAGGPAILAVAADLGGTRLIDNVLVETVIIDPPVGGGGPE
ncbi:MAG: pantoate--beta-alanine ligase [Nakamurella sp.]